MTTQANSLPSILKSSLSAILRFSGLTPFKHVTPQQLVFGYDDPLTSLANTYYPKGKRPPKKMGLFLLVCSPNIINISINIIIMNEYNFSETVH